MKNVYDDVRRFYEEESAGHAAVRREWIEGFLRQKAWSGANDEELKDIWSNLRMFLLYVSHTGTECLEDIPCQEFTLVIMWLADHVKGFKATLKPVRRFFNVLIEFYRYLAVKNHVDDLTGLELAAQEIAGGKKVKLATDIGALGKMRDILADEMLQVVNEVVEGLMVKLGAFFQRKEFNDDFQRALFLFAGPLNPMPEAGPEELGSFWQEFWDYFLFDYHLLANDKRPLQFFAESYPGGFSAEEQKIIGDLLAARFTVFTVQRVINQDWVECVNLFTNEVFRLPYPDFEYRAMKRMLFFGHVFARETVMANYITSVEISPNLRRRIKEEGCRQKAIFAIRQPEADWEAFFGRHALAFRHTVDALITLAKVNVTPFAQLDRTFPGRDAAKPVDGRVSALFGALMPEYGFSSYDIGLAGRLWRDFCQTAGNAVRKPGAWAAAVVYVYAQLNFPQGVSAGQLAADFKVSTSSVYANRDKIFKALELVKYDPRYLNEEGFIYSLFTS